jgi:hypothetical protein
LDEKLFKLLPYAITEIIQRHLYKLPEFGRRKFARTGDPSTISRHTLSRESKPPRFLGEHDKYLPASITVAYT